MMMAARRGEAKDPLQFRFRVWLRVEVVLGTVAVLAAATALFLHPGLLALGVAADKARRLDAVCLAPEELLGVGHAAAAGPALVRVVAAARVGHAGERPREVAGAAGQGGEGNAEGRGDLAQQRDRSDSATPSEPRSSEPEVPPHGVAPAGPPNHARPARLRRP